jgi:radical SAM superfamily enzyme YgiQ (UPF0313 family)
MLKSKGFSPIILDLSFPNMPLEKLRERLTQAKPDVVGITSMTSNYPGAVSVAKIVKLWNPQCVVVMGGVHATFMHREILETVPEIDVIVRYEGEYTMSELASALDKGGSLREIKGICFREEGKVVCTPFRGRIDCLDELPYPAHEVLEPSAEEYVGRYGARNFPVITTRGCPFGCIYCSTMAFHGRKYRTRSTANVIGELEYLVEKFKMNSVSFLDDNFTMQKDRVFRLCEEIKKRGFDLEWGCSARVDQVSEELLKAMKEARCKDIFFGIESTSQRVLNLVRKKFTIQQARIAVKAAEKLGIRTHCSFIIGLPGETPRSLSNIAAFIDETKPSGRVLPNLLDIFPGTELCERKEEYFANQPSISHADMIKTQLQIVTRFYRNNFGVNELYRVTPPNIILE